MTTQSYQQLIMQGIHGLPSDTLAEEEERETILLRNDLKQLSQISAAHLEKEFVGYEALYPKEYIAIQHSLYPQGMI